MTNANATGHDGGSANPPPSCAADPFSITEPFRPATGVDLKLTNACMFACGFCANADGQRDFTDANVKAVQVALEAWLATPPELGVLDRVFFTGGEPLMRMTAIESISAGLPDTVFTSVVTNGLLLSTSVIARLVAAGLNRVKVSYDTTDPHNLPQIRRGARHSDLLTIESNIRAAVQGGLLTYMRVALGRANAHELARIYQTALDYGVDTLQIKPVIASGRASLAAASLCLDPDEVLSALTAVAQIYTPHRTKVSISCFPQAARLGLPVKHCANATKLYWDVDGAVYICNYCKGSFSLLGNYTHTNGIPAALMARRMRYMELFEQHGMVAGCPALKYLNGQEPADVPST